MGLWKKLFGPTGSGLHEHPWETVIDMLNGGCENVDMQKLKAAFERLRCYTGRTSKELATSVAAHRSCPYGNGTAELTILHLASQCNREVVQWLLEMGARVNEKDEKGWTPLETAAYWCQKDIVALLMAHGSKPVAQTFFLAGRSNGHQATDGWRYPREEDVVEVLLQNSGIHEAAYWGCYKRVKALLQDNPGLVSSKDAEGETPLHHAVRGTEGDYKGVIELLIVSGADASAKSNKGLLPIPHLSNAKDALRRSLELRQQQNR